MTLFLMAGIAHGGLNTLYAFQQKAGLQPGSIKPVINGLENTGLLERSEGAKRGRRTMVLTEAGKRFLAAEWKKSLDAQREMESIIRSATVALLMGDIVESMNFLHRSACVRAKRQGPKELAALSRDTDPIDLNGDMRAVYESRRREMEAQVLEQFGMKLAEVFTESQVS